MLEHVGVEDGARAAGDGGTDRRGAEVQMGLGFRLRDAILSAVPYREQLGLAYLRSIHGTGFVSVAQNLSVKSVMG